MSFRGPKLPGSLLDQVQTGRVSKQRHQQSRKDKRKAERTAKKTAAPRTRPPPVKHHESPPPVSKPAKSAKSARPAKATIHPVPEGKPSKPAVEPKKRPAKSRAEEADDDEIAALEKKLGLNKKKSKKTGDGELDWLVFGSEDEDEGATSKRKRPEDDDWLRSKRRKATASSDSASDDSGNDEDELELEPESGASGDDDEEEEEEQYEEAGSGGDGAIEGPSRDFGDDFDGFDEGSEIEEAQPKKQRENPYVAPPVSHSEASVAKYVPPSLRKAATSDAEMLNRLRRQLQGLLNRLSEDNILSILQSIQDVYTANARQYVTATLIELLRDRICDPSTLNDTFLILHAGFAAALYRAVGTDFGAQLLESLVRAFDSYHRRQDLSADRHQTLSGGKQTLNIIAFLSNYYVLQAISSAIMFDYLRILLDRDNFSEANTELLLRTIRICGTQLRQDDPTALKDIVILLQKTVSAIGESNVSVRTKFMIETIHNLKNNRMKTGLAASALSAEHTQRMKKTLGAIKSAKTTEPLRINMADIRNSGKKGKWWLVGASWRDPAKMVATPEDISFDNSGNTKGSAEKDAQSDSDVDLGKLARTQGMNTDVRRAIFVAIAGAVDFEHAHIRLLKLNLKSKQQLEIPQVLLHCVGAEPGYNHFYSLVATKFCGDHKMRKAYQFALLDLCHRMGETGAESDDEDEREDDSLSIRKIYNLAKLYATLIVEGLLRLTVLKHLDFADLQPKTKVFVELLLSTVFVLLRKKTATKPKADRDAEYQKSITEIYTQAHAAHDLVAGLRYFLTSVLPESDVAANAKETQVVNSGCEYAVEALANDVSQRPVLMEDDMSDEDK